MAMMITKKETPTFEVTFTKKINLTRGDLIDILCSCIEGGSGYWACIDNTTPEYKDARKRLKDAGETDLTIEDVIFELWHHGDNLTIIDDLEMDEGDPDEAIHQISLSDFLKGIQLAIEGGEWDGEDTGDVDGAVGDAIMQYAVFGELIYG